MSAISMPETEIGVSAVGTDVMSTNVMSVVGSPSLLTADAQVRYVVAPQASAFGTHAAATAGVPASASASNRKWGRPPRGEPR